MNNDWSGGQYSLFRMILGIYLLSYHAVSLNPAWDMGPAPGMLRAVGVLLGACLAVGFQDRPAAVLLALLWSGSHLREPAPAVLAWAPLALVLLLHAALPSAPYLSWGARGRPDPGGGWRMPGRLFLAAWILLSLAYAALGITRLFDAAWLEWSALRGEKAGLPGLLENALWAGAWGFVGIEILFGPLALLPRARPWLWGLMLARHCAFAATGGAGPVAGLLVAHLFLFDPAWIPAAGKRGANTLFYDGECGLCHRAVRFLLAEDREGRAFRFAPLQGETFARLVPEAARAALPDSLVLRTSGGALLVRARCVRAILARLGGLWRVAGAALALLPARLADALYDAVARARRRIFRRPPELCPVMPADLRSRFDD